MQKIKCECGRILEVKEGVDRVKCPACGRDVKVAAAEDWLSSVSMEDMSLEGKEVAAEPELAAKPERAAAAAAAPTAGPAPGAPQPQPAAGPAGAKPPAPAAEREVGLIDLARMALSEPRDMIPHFERGIEDRTFIATMAGLFVALALVAAVGQTFAAAPRGFTVATILVNWFSVVCELATAGIILGLLCVAFRKDRSPLGVAEGLAFVRLGALAVMAPLYFIAGIAVLIASKGEDSGSTMVGLARQLPWGYTAIVLFGQTALIMGLFRLGCLPTLILGIVVTFAGYAMAGTLAGVFSGPGH